MRDLPLGQHVEIVDQHRHARIVAVGLLCLQREAFGQRARAHPGRIEPLHHRQHILDPHARHTQPHRQLVEIGIEIPRIVDRFDQRQRNRQRRTAQCRPRLPGQMLTQAEIGTAETVEIDAFTV